MKTFFNQQQYTKGEQLPMLLYKGLRIDVTQLFMRLQKEQQIDNNQKII